MKRNLALFVLRLALGFVAGGYSLALVVAQLRGRAYHYPLFLLGLAELAAAILFLIPATMRLGGLALVCIFACAAAFHISHGEYNIAYLVVYSAATWAVIGEAKRA
jgi:uncharacterized membrane protein YphA (DoxX/SURF4 family)